MRESEAWRILAEEHDGDRTKTVFLCVALDYAALPWWANPRVASIPAGLRDSMKSRIRRAIGDHGTAYELHEAGDRQARVLACLMFSEQAKDEERAK